MAVNVTIKDTFLITLDELISIAPRSRAADEVKDMRAKIKKLEYMVENGLGYEDLYNDISYPR